MSIPVFPLVVAVTGSILIELFFRLVKYKDSPAGGGYTPPTYVSNYTSVKQFVSAGGRRWIHYCLFRTLPVAIMCTLVAAIEQRYFNVFRPRIYVFITAILSLCFRDILVAFKKNVFTNERLVHVANIVMVTLVATGVCLLSDNLNLSFVAPSVEGLFDDLWSSLIATMLTVFYLQVTNMNTCSVSENKETVQFANYVLSSFDTIYNTYCKQIDALCVRYSCNKVLLYAILIYENMNRPWLIRKIENGVVRLFKCELTVGIAQVKSNKPLADKESIKIASEILKNTNMINLHNFEELQRIVNIYNPEDCYARAISDIAKVLCVYRKALLKEEK